MSAYEGEPPVLAVGFEPTRAAALKVLKLER